MGYAEIEELMESLGIFSEKISSLFKRISERLSKPKEEVFLLCESLYPFPNRVRTLSSTEVLSCSFEGIILITQDDETSPTSSDSSYAHIAPLHLEHDVNINFIQTFKYIISWLALASLIGTPRSAIHQRGDTDGTQNSKKEKWAKRRNDILM